MEWSGPSKILTEINLLEPILRGTKLKLGEEEHWIEFRYENLPTFCFYCGMIGHSDKQCEVKKVDIKRDVLRAGQFGEWLRGNSGGSNETKEMRTSSPGKDRGNSTSSKYSQPEMRVSPEESQQEHRGVLGLVYHIAKGSAIGIGAEDDHKSQNMAHLIQPGVDSSGKLGKGVESSMDLDDVENQVRSTDNLVNVPVVAQQDQYRIILPRQNKTFVRIDRTTLNVGGDKSEGSNGRGEEKQENLVRSKRRGEVTNQGIGEQNINPSVTGLDIDSWMFKYTAQNDDGHDNQWSISRREGKLHSVEIILLKIRDELIKGVEWGWHRVNIWCRDKELFKLISGKGRPDWSIITVVEDICSLLASFPICTVDFV
ncbi:retrotransposon protein [Striga asiatica]|uniref:Retrotransposon protein n=1 Tax=Striga asiatica TaxID=4170 RepID=A0A5A7PMR8_STRAF|nr:retrotransposon protein [Striga asiatica]